MFVLSKCTLFIRLPFKVARNQAMDYLFKPDARRRLPDGRPQRLPLPKGIVVSHVQTLFGPSHPRAVTGLVVSSVKESAQRFARTPFEELPPIAPVYKIIRP